MSKIFEKTKINHLTLKNRFVRSATWEGMASEKGQVTPQLIEKMAELAENEVGMIITGHAYVTPMAQAGPWQLGVYSDALLPGLKKMADTVHRAGSRIFLQLAHAGAHAATQLTKMASIGPSTIAGRYGGQCREMTLADIEDTVRCMTEAAARAQEAGFDGVQIHAAHGYLLSQFLSPFSNHRKDEYGGPLENRTRIVFDIIKGIRSDLGDQYPLIIKINSEDFVASGWAPDEMLQLAVLLESEGIDAIEMSGGLVVNPEQTHCARKEHPKTPEKEVYYKAAALAFKEKVRVPLMLVGGIRSFEVSENLVSNGIADYISLARPLISEPGLISRWKAGDRSKSMCVSCNKCYEPILEGRGVACPVAEKREEKAVAGSE